jgi:hypothetical protein
MPVGRLLREMSSYELTCWQQFFAAQSEDAADEDSGAEPEDLAASNQEAIQGLLAFCQPARVRDDGQQDRD